MPVLLRITHWPKSGLPVSPPGLFPPWDKSPNSPFSGLGMRNSTGSPLFSDFKSVPTAGQWERRPWVRGWILDGRTAVLQRMLLAVLADRNLSPLRLAHFVTLILLSFIEPTLLDITRLFTREISIVKNYKVCFSFVLDYLDDRKINVCVLGDRG